MRYSLNDFETYIRNNVIEKLSPCIELKIKELQSELSMLDSENYHVSNVRKSNQSNHSVQSNQASLTNFKTTEFTKREGINVHIYQIRKLFNMLTDKNYDKHSATIVEQINFVVKNNTAEEVMLYCNFCYQNLSSNLLYSTLSAQLYKTILENYSTFEEILNAAIKYDVIEAKIKKFVYVDPNIDYDKFCENNKLNESLRAEFSFFTNLLKLNCIRYEVIATIILNIYELVNTYIAAKTKKNEIDEISELLYILIANSYDSIKSNDVQLYEVIELNIQKIIDIKKETNSDLNNKCVFKHMDLLDLLKNRK